MNNRPLVQADYQRNTDGYSILKMASSEPGLSVSDTDLDLVSRLSVTHAVYAVDIALGKKFNDLAPNECRYLLTKDRGGIFCAREVEDDKHKCSAHLHYQPS